MYENEREIQKSLEQPKDMHGRPKWSECHTHSQSCKLKDRFDQKLLKECLAACQFLIV